MFVWLLSQIWNSVRSFLQMLGLVSDPSLTSVRSPGGTRVLVKAAQGRTVDLDLVPGWCVKDVKIELSSRLEADPGEFMINILNLLLCTLLV